jgi:formiminoglutamase
MTPDAERPADFMRVVALTTDLGDAPVTGDLEADQRALATLLAPHLGAGRFAIVLGGGHETAFGHFLGYVAAGLRPEILNWDAHADVRELRDGLGHSGSPFRQALEHSPPCRRYSVGGLQPQSVSAEHLAYVRARGEVRFRHELTAAQARHAYDGLAAPALVSFDLDAVDVAHAPGVSAPSAGGIGARAWLSLAWRAGRSDAVTSCDVVELNPALDRDGQTARLAALTVWQVLRGLATRPAFAASERGAS